jgi:hypothetical protein
MIMRQIARLLLKVERETERGTEERRKVFRELDKLANQLNCLQQSGEKK